MFYYQISTYAKMNIATNTIDTVAIISYYTFPPLNGYVQFVCAGCYLDFDLSKMILKYGVQRYIEHCCVKGYSEWKLVVQTQNVISQ